MADNDLALGRVVQLLSRTPWWQHMLIIVTEDDAQGGRDHVEAHRSILLMISPHVQRGYVSHTHASFGSIMRMIFILLNLRRSINSTMPRRCRAISSRTTPDYRPTPLVPIDRRLFDPDVAFKPFDRRFNWKAMLDLPVMDHPGTTCAGTSSLLDCGALAAAEDLGAGCLRTGIASEGPFGVRRQSPLCGRRRRFDSLPQALSGASDPRTPAKAAWRSSSRLHVVQFGRAVANLEPVPPSASHQRLCRKLHRDLYRIPPGKPLYHWTVAVGAVVCAGAGFVSWLAVRHNKNGPAEPGR
jgi:hypothetical protein